MAEKMLDKLYRLLGKPENTTPDISGASKLIVTPSDAEFEDVMGRPRSIITPWNEAAKKKPALETSSAALLLNSDGTVMHKPEIVRATDNQILAVSNLPLPLMVKDLRSAFPPMSEEQRRAILTGGPVSTGKVEGLIHKPRTRRQTP